MNRNSTAMTDSDPRKLFSLIRFGPYDHARGLPP